MKLLTKAIEKKLPRLYATESTPIDEKVLVVKFFTPWSNWTWYGAEYDSESKTFFGLVEGPDSEWGYFNLDELASIRGQFGLKVERDLYFDPIKFSQLKSN